MLEKLILLYFNIIALNPTLKISDGADISRSSQVLNMGGSSVTESTWKPIIHTHNWLGAPTLFAPTLSMSMTMPGATASSLENLNSRKSLADTTKYKQHNNTDAQIYHDDILRYSGNYGKDNFKTLTLTSTPLQSPPITTATPSQFGNILYPSLNTKNNKKINNNRRRDKYPSSTKQHPYQHQQQPNAGITNNKIETVYPQTQMPKDNKNRSYSISRQDNLKHLANTPERRELKNSSSSVQYWHYSSPGKHIRTFTSNANNTSNTINFEVKSNSANKTDNILTTRLNYFISNENLIDNQVANIKSHQQQNNYRHLSLPDNDVNYHVTDDENTLSKVTKSDRAGMSANAAVDTKENCIGETLRKSFKYAQELYDSVKDKVVSEQNQRSDDSDSYDDTAEGDDYNMNLNEDDAANDDNDLQILNLSSQQVFKDTATTVGAVIAAALEKLVSLNMKNMLSSLASTGEVEGRKEQINEGHIKYSLIKSLTEAATPLPSSSQDTNKTENTTQTKRTELRNFFTKDEIVSNLSSKSSNSSLLNASTSKGLAVFSSGRKLKKLKKKFEKFLLPLVLAYKLKFMTLIPLLIGGLILLVGSTGLAGFFFALFTAVMSLKTEHTNPIVVQKY